MTSLSVDVPYTNGMNYGIGISFLDGSIAGKAVDPGTPVAPLLAPGQTVRYALTIINSFEDLYTSLGISVEASGQYGLFKAAAKFAFASETKFNTQSTFVLARCVVVNAFTQVEDARIVEGSDGYNLLRQGKLELFQQRYGDGFIRGLQTGGEFFAVIAITSSTREEQESIAASLSASYGGLFASVSVSAGLTTETKSAMSRSEIQVNTYQRGGVEDQTAITTDIPAVMDRLKAFPAQVQANPVPYSAQLARYVTLALPEGPNPMDIEAQQTALRAYASTRLKIEVMFNDIQFVQTHPDLFSSPPEASVLNAWQDFLTTEYNAITHQASLCADNPKDGCPALPFKVPDGYVPIPRKVTNAISVSAAANSFPANIFKRTIAAPQDFEVTSRLVTSFHDLSAPGAACYIGLALYADTLNRAVGLLKGVDNTGNTMSAYGWGLSWNSPNIVPVGTVAPYPDDEVFLRLSRKGPQILDMSYSRDGADWIQMGKLLNLVDLGIPDGTPLRLIFIAYSTWEREISGTFYDTNVVPI